MHKNSTGLWLFLSTWMIMADYIMMSKAVFNGKYHTHPLSQLKMQLMRTYQNIVFLDSMVELGPTSFVDFCIYKVSRMFCINIVQSSLELEANNPDFFSRQALLLRLETSFRSSRIGIFLQVSISLKTLLHLTHFLLFLILAQA